MSAAVLPPLGHRVPDLPHAVSVQLPKWQDMIDFAHGSSRVQCVQEGGYPRSFIHQSIHQLHEGCVERFADPQEACLLFPSKEHALACKRYLREPPNGDIGIDDASICIQSLEFTKPVDESSMETPCISLRLFAVFFPKSEKKLAMIFWRLTGCGISSRLAEAIMPYEDSVRGVDMQIPATNALLRNSHGDKAEHTVRSRIAELLERAPVGGARAPMVTADDVFLYPTGMSAIYNLTLLLQSWPGTETVVFGFPYELTLKVQQDFAKGCRFYGFGTPEELKAFEEHLDTLSKDDRTIQAVWCECASNPLLRTVDLEHLRRLADKHGFLIIVDDTIGSFANVDVLGVADIVVTSLTKSFSGLADVMAGSIALNPGSLHYTRLQDILLTGYTNWFFAGDAVKLEENSRGFLARAAKMNTNAMHLVAMLEDFAESPDCPLQRIYYPSTCEWSIKNYQARMRPPTQEFVAGYGGLFTLEFDNVQSSAKFFDRLRVCKGPSLGAEVTLAQPYVQTVFKNDKDWAAAYGLSETIVRISVGVETTESLKRIFLEALSSL